MCKLSIITPYYNALPYIKNLANVLIPQLTKNIEWIIVDDGCNELELDNFIDNDYGIVKVIHLSENSGGASKPRNVGLDNATGDYIAFIDSDDMVKPNYIVTILNKLNSDFDYCFIGWKNHVFTITGRPPAWNGCVWNTIYKREIIGDERFREDLVIAEDYDFNCRVRKGKEEIIYDVLYYYNDTPNSLMKRGSNK